MGFFEFFTIIIRLTKNFFALISLDGYEKIKGHKWTASESAKGERVYAARYKTVNGQRQKIYMHRLITNCPPGMEVHHINGNTLDNRKANLRIVSKSENIRHERKGRKKSSGC